VKTIRIVLDKRLANAIDRAARQTKRSRSALVRDALRKHLDRLNVQARNVKAREERDRHGYAREPDSRRAGRHWEQEAAWPID
jgi:metal-responsive CopG/Arc/MetJ family transcriptional regulator